MKSNAVLIVVVAGTVLLYATAIVAGFWVKDFSIDRDPIQLHQGMEWTPPLESSIPKNALGESIRRGRLLFNETPLYASQNTGGKVACSSCHAEGGMQPYASPMVGLPAMFPMFNARAGHIISLQDRVQECFVRSENGKPLDYKGETMRAYVDYIDWLSQPEPNRAPFKGHGLVTLPDLKPDPRNGQKVYEAQCAGCHGGDGEGRPPMFPPVWGPESFNDGAGMNNLQKMAAFVQHNMPQNRMGILTPQQAYDVSAFIQAQPRPALNTAYKHF